MIQRRTFRRHFLFRPDREMNEIYLYCLAVAAKENDIAVHTVCLMSNHEHLTVTDRAGKLPLFLQSLHRHVALATKCLRNWEGGVWDGRSTSVVHLRTPDAMVDRMAYTLANPVEAGLVHRAKDWPGVTVGTDELGRKRWTVKRPRYWFSAKNKRWPAQVELELTLPDALLDAHGEEGSRRAIGHRLEELEQEAREENRRAGRAYLGARRALKVSPHERPRTEAPPSECNPTFAVGPGNDQEYEEAVEERRQWRVAYKGSLKAWRAGDRDASFPEGTWWMWWFHRAKVEGQTTDALAA